MNLLAHAFLAGARPESILGNLMADFHKGRLAENLHPGVREGVHFHRRIDAYCDAHPVFLQSCDRLRPRWGRYSGILVDMFYDHFLASDWDQYTDQPLREFVDFVYSVIRNYSVGLPDRFRAAAERMIHYDWLISYADPRKLETSLARISARSRNPDLRLNRAMTDLQTHYDDLGGDFHRFFPDLMDFVAEAKGMSSAC